MPSYYNLTLPHSIQGTRSQSCVLGMVFFFKKKKTLIISNLFVFNKTNYKIKIKIN